MDNYLTVAKISATPNPQTIIYAALHQDYCEDFVMYQKEKWPKTEKEAGEIAVKQLLKGGRGHFGCVEHPQIVLNYGWFPHSTMQQMRAHRIGVSFDVQSGRYTSQRIIDVSTGKREIEEVFYLRPLGNYTDRKGHKYEYTEKQRNEDLQICLKASHHYKERIDQGFSEEQARGLIPFDVRQHWVMSANARSLMHLLDLRWKANAQLECQWLCELTWPHFEEWVPEIAEWYLDNRAKKAKLAP